MASVYQSFGGAWNSYRSDFDDYARQYQQQAQMHALGQMLNLPPTAPTGKPKEAKRNTPSEFAWLRDRVAEMCWKPS